jgi:O-antigen/teichoic acid export membrane protein
LRRENLLRAGVISLAGSAVSAGAALLLSVLVGRNLQADGTGLFFQAVGFFTIVVQVLRMGTGTGIVRSLATQEVQSRQGEQTRILIIALVPTIALSTAAALLMWAFADEISVWLGSPGEDQSLAPLLRLLAPFVVVSVALGVLQSALRLMRGVLSFTLLQNILLPVSRLAVVFAVAGLGLEATMFGWAAPLPFWLVVTVAVMLGPVQRDLRARAAAPVAEGRETVSEFWRFSSARGVGATLEIVLDWSDVLIVAALSSPAEAGVYAVATRVVRAGQIVDRAVRVAASPTIAGLLADGARSETSELHTSVARVMVLAAWPFYLSLLVMGPAVLRVFGPEFVTGAPVLAMLSVTMMVAVAAGMLQSIILQAGRSRWQMLNKAVAVTISICLNLVLVPRLGIMGAAVTWVLVVVVDTSLAAYQVHRLLGVHLHPERLRGAMVTAVAVFGGLGAMIRLVAGTSTTALIIYLVVCCATYAAVLWLLRRRLGIEKLWRALSPRSFPRGRASTG